MNSARSPQPQHADGARPLAVIAAALVVAVLAAAALLAYRARDAEPATGAARVNPPSEPSSQPAAAMGRTAMDEPARREDTFAAAPPAPATAPVPSAVRQPPPPLPPSQDPPLDRPAARDDPADFILPSAVSHPERRTPPGVLGRPQPR
jgi:hypothetical protein